jgi:hypothetical protein
MPLSKKQRKKKARPPRVHVDKRTGKRYVVVNGKRIKIKSDHKDTDKIIQVIVNNILRSQRKRRPSQEEQRQRDFVKFSLFNLAEALESGTIQRARAIQGQLQAVGVPTPNIKAPLTQPNKKEANRVNTLTKSTQATPPLPPTPSLSFLDQYDFSIDPELFLDIKDELEQVKKEEADKKKIKDEDVVVPPIVPPSPVPKSSLSRLPAKPTAPVTRSKVRKHQPTKAKVSTSSLSTLGKGMRRRENNDDGLYTEQINHILSNIPGFRGAIPSDHIDKLPAISKQCCVMNTMPNGHPGEHWVAVLIDATHDRCVEYYDSFGTPPTKDFLKRLKKLIDRLNPETYLKLKVNKIVDQTSTSMNCGYHACHFLQNQLLKKLPFKECSGYNNARRRERNIERLKQLGHFGYI